ncbi:hypothetical protein [[Flexibacter] sp. ATCC 35208]|uniref:hypothetical protein n=1 Tax=[Flexibacter] sp. ATCC 35208 TaxID=1936242 RepID=UPI0009C48C2E|nr:hypothetical protein [[Flexibacter] sp. ATCC 35208]OMP74653.1 hypothetical protein BW716_34185 [[Flexibacter] sp. ATCC 35208]
MVNAKHSISITIDKVNIKKYPNGATAAGETKTSASVVRDASGKEISRDFKKPEITIYEKALEPKVGQDNMVIGSGETGDVKNLTMEDQIGAIGTHEGVHATDRNSSSVVNPNALNVEKAPYEKQVKYINEINKIRNAQSEQTSKQNP